MINMTQEPKELAPIKAQATKAYGFANTLEIKTDKDEAKAAAELSQINKIGDTIEEKKETIMRPLLDAQKATRAMFSPVEENIKNAVAIIKRKLANYHNEKEAARKVEEAKIAARLDKGTIKVETADKKIAQLETVNKSVETNHGQVQYKTVRKARFVLLETLTPENLKSLAAKGFLDWNEAAARKAALAGEVVPGVEIYEDTEIANKRA